MKNVLLISIALAFALTSPKANALTVENISVSDTGGISVSGEASATGTSDASAGVWSIIRGEGSNTRVRVDIRTSADGQSQATSVSRTLQTGERMEVRVATSSNRFEPLRVFIMDAARPSATSSSTSTQPRSNLFVNLRNVLSSLFGRVLDFWR